MLNKSSFLLRHLENSIAYVKFKLDIFMLKSDFLINFLETPLLYLAVS